MKKTLLTFGLSLFVLSNLLAQEFCHAPSLNNHNQLESFKSATDYSNYSFCITLYVHVIRKDDGSGGQTPSGVNSTLQYLEDAFTPHQIFFDTSNSINYIDDSTLYNSPSSIMSITTHDHSDGVDMYLFDNSVNHPISGGGYGLTAGIGVSSKFLVTGSYTGIPFYPIAQSFVVAHEMGHVLNLYHTRHGTVSETGDPSQCPELVDGSNGTTCGDYCADTPADPGMNYNIYLSTCTWLGSGTDENGDPYDPDELNIMGQTHPQCMEYFTSDQKSRMKNAMVSKLHLASASVYSNSILYPCGLKSPEIMVYPNPANKQLHISPRLKTSAYYSYSLYNGYGIRVSSGKNIMELESIDTSSLPQGIYFLRITINNEITIKQIHIQR